MLTSVTYRLGHWTFLPSAHELRSGAARVRLEQRASATLSLLCENGGGVVSRDQIIDRAWGRRHLSPNSVAIVIGDLRRAIDIPAGEPGSIQTVPKAGYRLIESSREAPTELRTRWPAFAPLAILLLAALALAAWAIQPVRPEVAVGGIQNSMGTERHAALIKACSETLVVELGRHSGDLRIIEDPPSSGDRPDLVLQQRWVLWSGAPELILVAKDRSGHDVWSGAIYGEEGQFPAKISEKVGDFAALARTRRFGR